MKKTVSFLIASSFLISSVYAGEKMVVASAASQQSKAAVVKAKAKAAEKSAPADYALESFGCCGLPQ